jgi:hypothetical protein
VRGARLTCRSVANIVKAYAERAGLDPAVFSGHSLPAGFLTSAAGRGVSIFKTVDVSRHKSVDPPRGAMFGMQSYSRIMQVPVCSKAGSAPMPRWQGAASLP